MIDAADWERLPDHVAGNQRGAAAKAEASERAVDVVDTQLPGKVTFGVKAAGSVTAPVTLNGSTLTLETTMPAEGSMNQLFCSA